MWKVCVLMKKIFLFDFDGTLVTEDILDVVCDIVGKKEESRKINADVISGKRSGLEPLITRINFLNGVTYEQIKEKLDQNNYLRDGVLKLFKILNERGYITVLSSGNIEPVLRYYQELLNITYIFGSSPYMEGDTIKGISEDRFKGHNFKYLSCLDVIKKQGDQDKIVYGIGDSAVDKEMLSLADIKFAIEPKGGLENHVDYVITDIEEIIGYLDNDRNNVNLRKLIP